jgi:predicted TIM-barrel enzyme
VPVLLASGLGVETAALARACDGAIVSSALRHGGRAGAALERDRALALVEAVRAAL